TMGNWIAEFLAAKERIKLVHVAYKGGAQAVLDLVAGHVKVGMLTWSIVAEHVRAGRLVALATTSGQRLPYRADADIARARPSRFRRHDLVFALGTGGAFSRHRGERQPRGRQGLGAAASEAPDRARRDRSESHESGRGHPLHAERDRPLDADDHAIGRREVA